MMRCKKCGLIGSNYWNYCPRCSHSFAEELDKLSHFSLGGWSPPPGAANHRNSQGDLNLFSKCIYHLGAFLGNLLLMVQERSRVREVEIPVKNKLPAGAEPKGRLDAALDRELEEIMEEGTLFFHGLDKADRKVVIPEGLSAKIEIESVTKEEQDLIEEHFSALERAANSLSRIETAGPPVPPPQHPS